MNPTSVLQMIIQAKDLASSTIQQTQGSVEGLGGVLRGAATAAGILGAAMAAIKLGEAVFEMGRASAASLRLQDSYETLAEGVGQSSQKMLEVMRAASLGTIDDTALMGNANRAILLNVASSAEDMQKLLELSAARGKAMGRTSAEALGDIVTGIGRLSPMILDNLGIVIDQDAAYKAFAASLGTTAEKLSETEKKQALLNAAYESSRTLIESNKQSGVDFMDSFARMDTALSNAKDALGQLFTPAAAAIAEQIAAATNRVTEGLVATKEAADLAPLTDKLQTASIDVQVLEGEIHGLGVIMAQLQDESIDMSRVMVGAWGQEIPQAVMGSRSAMMEWVSAAIASRTESLALANVTRDAASAHLDLATGVDSTITAVAHYATLAQQAASTTEAMAAATVAAAQVEAQRTGILAALNAEIAKTKAIEGIGAAASGQLKGSFKGTVGVSGAAGAQAGFEAADATLKSMVESWQAVGKSEVEVEFLAAAYVKQITEANSELLQTAKSTKGVDEATRALEKAAQEAERAFDDLTSKVSGVLTGALSVDVGVDPAEFLPRPDAINEDARRLADVVIHGFDSPWAEYLNNKFPDMFKGAFEGGDLKGAAAQALLDFQDGLNPDLLDKEAAKDRVRRMLLGEANMAALAQEIAAELSAEMGGAFSPEQIQAATGAAFGTGGVGAEAGGQLGEGMADGVTGQGIKIIQAIGADLKKSFELLTAKGKEAGAVWGAGFTSVVGENVPPQLISILTQLVTPGVYAMLTQQGSLTGAEE